MSALAHKDFASDEELLARLKQEAERLDEEAQRIIAQMDELQLMGAEVWARMEADYASGASDRPPPADLDPAHWFA